MCYFIFTSTLYRVRGSAPKVKSRKKVWLVQALFVMDSNFFSRINNQADRESNYEF